MHGAGAPSDGGEETRPRKMVGNGPIQVAPPWKLDNSLRGLTQSCWACGRSSKDPLPQPFECMIQAILVRLWGGLGDGVGRRHGSAPFLRCVGPTPPSYLLRFGWATTGAALRRWLSGTGGLDPGEYVGLVPAKAAAVWKFERSRDQVGIFSVGCARPDRCFCFANERGQLFDKQNLWQVVRVNDGLTGRLCWSARVGHQ